MKSFLISSFVAFFTPSSSHSSSPVVASTIVGSLVGDSASLETSRFHIRSNATHAVWQQQIDTKKFGSTPVDHSIRQNLKESSAVLVENQNILSYSIQTWKDVEADCLNFLQDNLMSFDLPFRETLGFPMKSDDEDDSGGADGLGNGLVRPTIQLALQAKRDYPWTDMLPKEIFFEYVLNFANLNEARTNWRPLLVDALRFNESDLWQKRGKDDIDHCNMTAVVTWVNQNLWTRLGRPDKPIVFKSGQTPLIFDPMSIIAYGYASCTGTSILFANALRAVGIPARVVGTPAWYGNRTQGNHNWVEVFVMDGKRNQPQVGEWKFLEPSPANAGLDTLDNDPCMRWFCDSTRYPASRVYAARLKKHSGDEPAAFFPLAWEWDNQDVPAVDRTKYYEDICSRCDGID